jgi:hypothetical protein
VTPAVFQYIVVVIAGVILIVGVILIASVILIAGVIIVVVEVDDVRATDELLGSGWERSAVSMALSKLQTPLLFPPEPPSRSSGDFSVGTLTQANNKLCDQLPLQGRSSTSNEQWASRAKYNHEQARDLAA